MPALAALAGPGMGRALSHPMVGGTRGYGRVAMAIAALWIPFAALQSVGCMVTPGTDEPGAADGAAVCREAAEHLASCLESPPALDSASCDPRRAGSVLAMSCEDVIDESQQGKADGWFARFLCSLGLTSYCSAPPAPACEVTPELDGLAHDFMAAHGLIRDDDERSLSFGSFEWRLRDVTDGDDGCLLTMKICFAAGQNEPSDVDCEGLEVLGLRDGVVEAFETAVGEHLARSPIEVKFQLGAGYYVTLEGDSAVAARKALAVGEREVPAFTAYVVRGTPPPFDPTPGRDWHVAKARYDLRRGLTAEVLDVQALHWDMDFDGFFGGAAREEIAPGIIAGVASPWGGSLARVLADGGVDADEVAHVCRNTDLDPASPLGLVTPLTEAEAAACAGADINAVQLLAFTLRDASDGSTDPATSSACFAAYCR